MGRGRSPERVRFWRGLIEEQRQSGESVSGFCRDREVSTASFYNWRRRLAEEGVAEKFVAIELPSPPTRACCEIVLPDGCRVVVPPGHDPDSLRSILSILHEEEPPC